MKICIAQTKPIAGNISKNMESHIRMVHLAVEKNTDIIIFPELSLTGYEPELAKQLATTADDERLDVLQNISDANHIIIGIGIPTVHPEGICISLVLFRPHEPRLTYSKEHLHPGEENYFVQGKNTPPVSFKNDKLAFAICYETSIPEHSEKAFEHGANNYLASVVNSFNSVDNDINRISAIAKNYRMTAVMANFVGTSGGFDCAGKSSIWNDEGVLVVQLDQTNEGIAIFDTVTQKVIKVQH